MSLTRDYIEALKELHPTWSYADIARHVGVHVQTVHRVRRWGSAANANRYYQALALARGEARDEAADEATTKATENKDVVEEVSANLMAEDASARFLRDMAKTHRVIVKPPPDPAAPLPKAFHPDPHVQSNSPLLLVT
jgi:IS30 family transposase